MARTHFRGYEVHGRVVSTCDLCDLVVILETAGEMNREPSELREQKRQIHSHRAQPHCTQGMNRSHS